MSSVSPSLNCKGETKQHTESAKKQDFYKKEKANAKNSEKNSTVKHDKVCAKPEVNDVNKIPKFKYENEIVGKPDYAINQIPNYHTTQAHYQWTHPAWEHARMAHGTWDQNRFLDMKNPEKNPYFDKYQSFNLSHLDNMPKSPQKIHHKFDQKNFHDLAYTALSASMYQATSLAHFKDAKSAQPKLPEFNQKSDCKVASRQSKNSTCQSQCDNKAPKGSMNAYNTKESQIKHIMEQQNTNPTNKSPNECSMAQNYERQQSNQMMNINNQCKNTNDHFNHTNVSTHQSNTNQCGMQENKPEKKNTHQTCKKEDLQKDNTSQQITSQKEEICQSVSPALPSMGVYTPDSTSNSVHSVQYNPCELDVSQLGLESPSSIASDLASPCSMLHMHPSPQHVPHPLHSSIHIPPIMTGNQPKQKNVHNRSRYVRSL